MQSLKPSFVRFSSMFLFSFGQLLRSLTFDFHILSLALITISLQAKKWTNKLVGRMKKDITVLQLHRNWWYLERTHGG